MPISHAEYRPATSRYNPRSVPVAEIQWFGGHMYANTNEWSDAKRKAYQLLYDKTEADMRAERMWGEKLNRRVRLIDVTTRGGLIYAMIFMQE